MPKGKLAMRYVALQWCLRYVANKLHNAVLRLLLLLLLALQVKNTLQLYCARLQYVANKFTMQCCCCCLHHNALLRLLLLLLLILQTQ